MNLDALFSSEKDDWETPPELFDRYNRKYGFTIDLAASESNHKCPEWYGLRLDPILEVPTLIDAFAQTWGGRCWLNPPYGEAENACKANCKKKRCKERGYHLKEYRPGTVDWMRKARESVLIDKTAEVVCMLLPSRTDTKWFHQWVWDFAYGKFRPGVHVDFLPGRVKFLADGIEQGTAPFPSMVVTFERS